MIVVVFDIRFFFIKYHKAIPWYQIDNSLSFMQWYVEKHFFMTIKQLFAWLISNCSVDFVIPFQTVHYYENTYIESYSHDPLITISKCFFISVKTILKKCFIGTTYAVVNGLKSTTNTSVLFVAKRIKVN